jgi:hypothetical protein
VHPSHTHHPHTYTRQQDEDVLSWDSDELTRIHNLHMREFTNLEVSGPWSEPPPLCVLCRWGNSS